MMHQRGILIEPNHQDNEGEQMLNQLTHHHQHDV